MHVIQLTPRSAREGHDLVADVANHELDRDHAARIDRSSTGETEARLQPADDVPPFDPGVFVLGWRAADMAGPGIAGASPGVESGIIRRVTQRRERSQANSGLAAR
jgi:hypothetical protein